MMKPGEQLGMMVGSVCEWKNMLLHWLMLYNVYGGRLVAE